MPEYNFRNGAFSAWKVGWFGPSSGSMKLPSGRCMTECGSTNIRTPTTRRARCHASSGGMGHLPTGRPMLPASCSTRLQKVGCRRWAADGGQQHRRDAGLEVYDRVLQAQGPRHDRDPRRHRVASIARRGPGSAGAHVLEHGLPGSAIVDEHPAGARPELSDAASARGEPLPAGQRSCRKCGHVPAAYGAMAASCPGAACGWCGLPDPGPVTSSASS